MILKAEKIKIAIAIIRNIGPLMFDRPPAGTAARPGGKAIVFSYLHLALAFTIAFAMPSLLLHALSNIAAALQ